MCKANFPFLDCIGRRQPWGWEVLSNFHTNTEFIVSIASLSISAWKHQELWEWWGGGRDVKWRNLVKGAACVNIACPERFAHGGGSPSFDIKKLQSKRGIHRHWMSHLRETWFPCMCWFLFQNTPPIEFCPDLKIHNLCPIQYRIKHLFFILLFPVCIQLQPYN